MSYYDLEKYFAGSSWEFGRRDDGSVTAKSEAYDVKLVQKPSKYEVRITSTEDPSDSDKAVTDDPVEFITKFLSTGTEADDVLKKMSFSQDPNLIVYVMSRAKVCADTGILDARGVSRMVRRGKVAADLTRLQRLFTAVVRAVAGAGDDVQEVAKVTKDMKEKGWKVVQGEDEGGYATLKVDVSGIYEAEVRARDTVWDYTFQVNGIDESKEEGTTDDPLQQFRLYYKKDSTQDFRKQLKEQKAGEADPDATVAPGKDRKKLAPKKPVTGPPSEGTEQTLIAPTQLPPSSKTRNIPKKNKHSDSDKPEA